jgi:hypothetical protein
MEGVRQSILRDAERLEIPFPDWESIQIPVRSTVDGSLLAPTESKSNTLLDAALGSMLIHPVNWQATVSNILDSASRRLESDTDLHSCVLALGPNANSLFTAAKGAALHQRLDIEHVYVAILRDWASLTLHSPSSKLTPADSWRKSDIAIVGMSVDVPGCENLHDFWNMMQNSTNVATEVTDHSADE